MKKSPVFPNYLYLYFVFPHLWIFVYFPSVCIYILYVPPSATCKLILYFPPKSHGATHSSVSALLIIVSGRGKECLGVIILRCWSSYNMVAFWWIRGALHKVIFDKTSSNNLGHLSDQHQHQPTIAVGISPDHGPIQAIFSHNTSSAPGFARFPLLRSPILKPHLKFVSPLAAKV